MTQNLRVKVIQPLEEKLPQSTKKEKQLQSTKKEKLLQSITKNMQLLRIMESMKPPNMWKMEPSLRKSPLKEKVTKLLSNLYHNLS